MQLLTLLTTLAENTHHQISVSELMKEQPEAVQEALSMHNNTHVRNLLAGSHNNFPDRDRVATIKR